MADQALCLRALHRLVQAAAVARLGTERRIMELIQVEMIGFQPAERSVKLAEKFLRRLRRRFGGKKHLIPHICERASDFLLTVRIKTGGVEKADSVLERLSQQGNRLILPDPLEGKRAESVFIDGDSRLPKCDPIHFDLPFHISARAPF